MYFILLPGRWPALLFADIEGERLFSNCFETIKVSSDLTNGQQSKTLTFSSYKCSLTWIYSTFSVFVLDLLYFLEFFRKILTFSSYLWQPGWLVQWHFIDTCKTCWHFYWIAWFGTISRSPVHTLKSYGVAPDAGEPQIIQRAEAPPLARPPSCRGCGR